MGAKVKASDGAGVGKPVVGASVSSVGVAVGLFVGALVGALVGSLVG